MSIKNVRRNAFRMQRALCGIASGLGILLALSTDAWATRGRVKVANNTIVTDTGSLIRGARVSLDIWDETPTQANITTMKNSRGLNAFHIYAEYPGGGSSGGYNSAKVDKVVDLADTNDLYVVLTIGSGGGNGTFNQSFVTSFWNFYAPRYKDKTHVIYEVCNEPQAWSAPYNNNTLTMEKNAYAQIRGLAPDTHIMMMSYSQVVNPTQAATECAGLGVTWDNASVAFHTYGIDGKEDASLTAFYTAMKGKGIAYACTEPNLTLKAITTKLFERDGVSETQFINVSDIATNASAFTSWITSNNICWTPDFGTWPSCSGSVPGTGGSSGTGGRVGTGGSTSTVPGTGGRVGTGGSTSTVPGSGRDAGVGGATAAGGAGGEDAGVGGAVAVGGASGRDAGAGGAAAVGGASGGHTGVGGAATAGGTSGTGGVSGSGGQQGVGGASNSGGAPSGSGGSSSAGGAAVATGGGAGGRSVGPLGGAPYGGAVAGNGMSNGCSCTVGKGHRTDGRGTEGGIALLLGLWALAFIRRLP